MGKRILPPRPAKGFLTVQTEILLSIKRGLKNNRKQPVIAELVSY